MQTVSTENEVSHFLNKPIAFLSQAENFYTAALQMNYKERFLCVDVKTLPASRHPYKYGMLVKKRSQYREFFNHRYFEFLPINCKLTNWKFFWIGYFGLI